MGEENGREVVLVTGGVGYIGSHVVLELLASDRYQPVVVDNCSNSSQESLCRVEGLAGKTVCKYDVDLLDIEAVRKVFRKHQVNAVIHLAGLKAVGESVQKPLLYYHTNLNITLNLLNVMSEFGVKNMVFSSSATIYGAPQKIPIDEHHPVGQGCANPYGRTKYFVEEVLRDVVRADPTWNVTLLRYVNPVGAHKSGEIGEDPRGVPNNLMPYVLQVLVGVRSMLSVYGNDYDTCDGTGVRDYIHVMDLAQGHVCALEQLLRKTKPPSPSSSSPSSSCGGGGLRAYNLGTGKGVSVLELVGAMEKASGRKVPYKVVGRRAGDVGTVVADISLAREELGWTASKGLEEMCEDAWRWQSKNPNGYASTSGPSQLAHSC